MNINKVKSFIGGHPFTIYDYNVKDDLFANQELIDSAWYNNLWMKTKPQQRDAVTFDGCIKAKFFVKMDALCCTLIVYEGESLSGTPIREKCYFNFEVKKITPYLTKKIKNHCYNLAEQKYEEELEKQKEIMITKIFNEMIS